MLNYGFYRELDENFETVIDSIEKRAKEHNFGVISRVNIDEKFKEKLEIDYKKYTILGLCNPENAHHAIQIEENIGLLLPCNAIVYEKNNKTAVAIIRPTKVLNLTGNRKLKEVASKIERELKTILKEL